jgi:hypothetical protein
MKGFLLMASIPDSQGKTQALAPATYHYALKITPEGMKRLSPEQLLALCIEQYFILSFVLTILRNPVAAVASRIVAIELFIGQVEKTVKHRIQSVTEKSPIYISGEYGIAKKLGMHANTISKSLNSLEKCRVIERDYRFDEATQREHLDVTLTPLFLANPRAIRDKTERRSATTIASTGNTNLPKGITCSSCGSNNVHLICIDCGVDITATTQVIESTLDETLLHKFCVVSDNNPPLNATVVCEDDPILSAVAQNVKEVSRERPHIEEEQTSRADLRQIAPPSPIANTQNIVTWLEKRRGHARLIYATGSAEFSKKYKNKPQDYEPDYPAYLAGDKWHILGSYLLREDAKTFVLAFDIDDQTIDGQALHTRHEDMLLSLASAGAAPVYWQRQNGRGHLELYFDSPVNPEAARAFCIATCSLFEQIDECYPAHDKRNQPISWPFYQRKGDQVTPSIAKVLYPHTTTFIVTGVHDVAGLAQMITNAVTPASLIPPGAADESNQVPEARRMYTPPPSAPAQTDKDVAKIVIAEFNQQTTWDEVVSECGGFNRERKFKAVWRNERSPSVAIDPDEAYACDYGRTGAYPKKLDKYEVWCLAKGGRDFKRFDLAQRIDAYRKRQQHEPTQISVSATTPEPEENRQPQEAPAPPVRNTIVQQPNPDETADEVVERLRQTTQQSKGYVVTPAGAGKLWQLWPTRIGVVLDSAPERVTFFSAIEDLRAIHSSSTLDDSLS